MSIKSGSLEADIRDEVMAGMMFVNCASVPFRAMNVVIGGIVHLAASSHPAAKEAIGKLGQMIHETWHNSSLGKNWADARVDIIEGLHKMDIPKNDISYFLDSVEELALAGATEGVGSLAKAAFKVSRHVTAQIRGRNSGFPVIEDIFFNPVTANGEYYKRQFAANTAAEGFITYRYVRGNQDSVLVYLNFIQKGKVVNWNVPSSHAPYSASQAGIDAIKEIGKELGAKKLFLQFEPENPKFLAYVEKRYPSKGEHLIYDTTFKEMAGPFPVFELISPSIGTANKILKATSPFAMTESLRVLSNECYIPGDLLSVALLSPACARDAMPQASPASPSTQEPEIVLSDADEIVATLGQHIMDFAGSVCGVKPAVEELRQVRELVKCLVTNPQRAPVEVVAKLLQQPISAVQNIINNPNAIAKDVKQFINNPAMGALAAVGTIMTFMDSVSWLCEFVKKPGKGAKNVVKMPYMCVKGVVQLGISLIRHPEKTAKQLCKSLIKAPEYTVKRFLTAVGIKKKKKKQHESPPQIDPKELERMAEKYAVDLMLLYFVARIKGFVDPFKTVEEYHHDLFDDWNSGHWPATLPYFEFPQFLMQKMDANSLVYLRSFSPKAHPYQPMISPEILLAADEMDSTLQKVEAAFEELHLAHQQHSEATHQLNEERTRIGKATEKLGALLDNNSDKIKQALLERAKVKNGALQ